MKTTHRNLIFLTLLLSLPAAHATITLTASDTFSAPSGSTPGNLVITGDLSVFKGLDVGTTAVGALPASAINIDWYNTALLPKTASFDLTDADATFQWRDNLAAGAAVRNKMTLNSANVLSLYNATGAAANISLNGSTGAINLTGVGSGISANGTPIFTLDSAGKVNFSNSGTSQNTNTTPSTSPTTGALTLAGGLGVMGSINTAGRIGVAGNIYAAADSTFNGVLVGKGGGADISNTAVGYSALRQNTIGLRNTVMGFFALRNHNNGNDNTVVGYGFTGINTGGSSNSLFGANAYLSGSNSIVIGANGRGEGSNTTVIGNSTTTRTHLFGETASDRLKVSGSSHLGATAENLDWLPVGVTGSCYGPIKTGSNFYQYDFLFTKTGDEITGDFMVPLGGFSTSGGDLTVDISTPGTNEESGSAHFVVGRKYYNDDIRYVTSEHHAIGGATDIELRGRNDGEYTLLAIKFNAKNDYAGQVAVRTLQVKVSGLGNGWRTPNPSIPTEFFYPITMVDSTTCLNSGKATKTITAAEIKLDGKVTISQPQGDISMGIYQ